MAHTSKNILPTYDMRDTFTESFVYNIHSTLFNYLAITEDAIPSPLNAVYAVNNSKRKSKNGANIELKFAVNSPVLFNGQKQDPFKLRDFRVETNVFYDTLTIPASRASAICGTTLVFGNKLNNTFYISKGTNSNWLCDIRYAKEVEKTFTKEVVNPYTKEVKDSEVTRTYYTYSIIQLLNDGLISKVDMGENTFSVVNFLRLNDEKTSDYKEYKLVDMNETCEFQFIQKDGRAAKTIYFFDGRSWRGTTVNVLAKNIACLTKAITETSAQQKVRRLLKTSELLDQATPCVVGKETWFIGYKRDLQLGDSTTANVTLTKKNIGDKLRVKFANNYKRHGEEPGKKWSDEEKELYKTYCETKKAKEEITEELNDANEVVGTIFDDADAKDYRENLQKQLETVAEALKDEDEAFASFVMKETVATKHTK